MKTSSIIGLDIKNFSNPDSNFFILDKKRKILFEAVGLAVSNSKLNPNSMYSFTKSGILMDGGDGFMMTVETSNLLDVLDFFLRLDDFLRVVNGTHKIEYSIKLRGVLHYGDYELTNQNESIIELFSNKVTANGDGIISTARYLDSEPLRNFLDKNKDKIDFCFGLSEEFYEHIKKATGFLPYASRFIKQSVEIKEKKFNGTIYLYNYDRLVINNNSTSYHEITSMPPSDLGKFIGRSKDIEQLSNIIKNGKINDKGEHISIVSITAVGGTGKTRLLLELLKLNKNNDSRFDAVVWYSFYNKEFQDIATFIRKISEAFNLPTKNKTTKESTDILCEYIRKNKIFLAVDGIEVIQTYLPDSPFHGKLNEINIDETNKFSPILNIINTITINQNNLIILTTRIPLNNQDIDNSRLCYKHYPIENFELNDAYDLFKTRGGQCNEDEFKAYFGKYGGHPLSLVAVSGLLSSSNRKLNGDLLEYLLRDIEELKEINNKEALKLYRIFSTYFEVGIPKSDNSDELVKFTEEQIDILIFIAMHTLSFNFNQIMDMASYFTNNYSQKYSVHKSFLEKNLKIFERAGFIEINRVEGQIDQLSMHPLVKEIIPIFSKRNKEIELGKIVSYLLNREYKIPDFGGVLNSGIAITILDRINWYFYTKNISSGWSYLKKYYSQLENAGFSIRAFNMLEKFYVEIRDKEQNINRKVEIEILLQYYNEICYYCFETRLKDFDKTIKNYDQKEIKDIVFQRVMHYFSSGNIKDGEKELSFYRQVYGKNFDYFLYEDNISIYSEVFSMREPSLELVKKLYVQFINDSIDNESQSYLFIARLCDQMNLVDYADKIFSHYESVKPSNILFYLFMQYRLVRTNKLSDAEEWEKEFRDLLESRGEYSFFISADLYLLLSQKKYKEIINTTPKEEKLLAFSQIWKLIYFYIAKIWAHLYISLEEEKEANINEAKKIIVRTEQIMEEYKCYFDVVELKRAKAYLKTLESK